MSDNFDWLGGQLSLYPPIKKDNSLNIVSGIEAVNARLIQLLLMRKGEDPIFPQLGFAPDLFASKSARDPFLYSYNLSSLLAEWNDFARIGMKSFSVKVFDPPTLHSLDIVIEYVPVQTSNTQVLTFGFWEYVEAFTTNNIATYLESVKFSTQ